MSTSPLEDHADPRHQLGHFLRARREAMSAAALATGSAAGRRRTPGLRREEVAELAGISTTWYTWLEQGRDIALSAAALARLAQVLKLSAAERGYLFELAQRHDPVPAAIDADEAVSPVLRAMVEAMPMPAYLLDRGWRRCACNGPAAELFAPWLASGEPCLLRYVFLDPAARDFICDWDERANRLVAEFRADSVLYPEDVALTALLAELRQASPAFAASWERHGVLAREGGRRTFLHPQWGQVSYQQVTLLPSAGSNHKLVLLMPADSVVTDGN